MCLSTVQDVKNITLSEILFAAQRLHNGNALLNLINSRQRLILGRNIGDNAPPARQVAEFGCIGAVCSPSSKRKSSV